MEAPFIRGEGDVLAKRGSPQGASSLSESSRFYTNPKANACGDGRPCWTRTPPWREDAAGVRSLRRWPPATKSESRNTSRRSHFAGENTLLRGGHRRHFVAQRGPVEWGTDSNIPCGWNKSLGKGPTSLTRVPLSDMAALPHRHPPP
ncbi:hypothetical protein BHM03_00005855 [Ensete ventricosum]|nr:hypothetical protein BHM03_00005855 [Ensete ventricosum]